MKKFIKYKSLNIALFLIIVFLIGGCKKESGSTSLAPSETKEDTILTQEDKTVPIQKEYDDEEDFIVTFLEEYDYWDESRPYAVSIDGYKGNKKKVRIPPEIQNLPVHSIGEEAFYEKQLTMVLIPDSVWKIGKKAFSRNNLTSITIPDNVREIEDWAFSENNLTDITIPSNIKEIGNWVFYKNKLTDITMYYGLRHIGYEAFAKNQLTDVKIPDSVVKIKEGAFADNQLTSVTTPEECDRILENAFENNPITTVIVRGGYFPFGHESPFPNKFSDFANYVYDGIDDYVEPGIYTWNGSSWSVKRYEYTDPKEFEVKINDDGQSVTITRYLRNYFKYQLKGYFHKNTTVNIPPRLRGLPVTVIGGFSASDLTSVIIPEGVTRIEECAFQYNYLTSVIIPDSVTDIGQAAFFSNRLTDITFGKNIINIGIYAFGDNELTGLTLGNNVTTIGAAAFCENKITRVKLSDSLKVIYDDAFRHNGVLEITIPKNVSMLDRPNGKETQIFLSGFEEFYKKNEKKGGTYIYNKDKKTWSFNK
jgi:hypothetical protein